jgi:hypothetical protein
LASLHTRPPHEASGDLRMYLKTRAMTILENSSFFLLRD